MSTPICLGCGAKFSHDNAGQRCKKCGIPDEIAKMGIRMIKRWRKRELRKSGMSKREAKRVLRNTPGTRFKRSNKHGRRGALKCIA